MLIFYLQISRIIIPAFCMDCIKYLFENLSLKMTLEFRDRLDRAFQINCKFDFCCVENRFAIRIRTQLVWAHRSGQNEILEDFFLYIIIIINMEPVTLFGLISHLSKYVVNRANPQDWRIEILSGQLANSNLFSLKRRKAQTFIWWSKHVKDVRPRTFGAMHTKDWGDL